MAGLPAETLDAGGKLALVTMGPTPYDGVADVKLSGDVVAELEARRSPAARERLLGGVAVARARSAASSA